MNLATHRPAHLHQRLQTGLHVLRWRQFSFLLCSQRLRVQLAVCALLCLSLGVAMMAGSTWLSPAQLLSLLTPNADASADAMQLLLFEFRLPRIVVGMLAGCALAISGLLLQSMTQNKLASPDMLAVSDGASLALFLGLLANIGGNGMLGPWWLAPLGAFASVALLLIIAGRRALQADALLIIGLSLASLLRAGSELALARQELQHASALYAWSIGNLNGRGYASASALAIALAICVPLLLWHRRQLGLLSLGQDCARSLGVAVTRLRWQALLIGVALAGLAIGVCGPLAFIALAAPQIALRLHQASASQAAPVFTCGMLGAMLVTLADTLGRSLQSDAELPVGVMCNLLGGPFLLWLVLKSK